MNAFHCSILIAGLLTAGCNQSQPPTGKGELPGHDAASQRDASNETASQADTSNNAPAKPAWRFEAIANQYRAAWGNAGSVDTITIGCDTDRRELVTYVSNLRRIGSEERLTLGLGGDAITMVAENLERVEDKNPIRASIGIPDNIDVLLASREPISGRYGNQEIGPFPPLPPSVARDLANACHVLQR